MEPGEIVTGHIQPHTFYLMLVTCFNGYPEKSDDSKHTLITKCFYWIENEKK